MSYRKCQLRIVLQLAVCASIVLLSACLSSQSQNSQTDSISLSGLQSSSQDSSIISYNIVKDETTDIPIKTQVEMQLIVSGQLTEDGLRKLLLELYAKIISRSGFKYYSRPTNVYIYAYTDQIHLNDGAAWVAMLQKNFDDTNPKVDISQTKLTQLTAPKEERFGYTEGERFQIFQNYVGAEDRARKESQIKYPSDSMKAYDLQLTLQEQYKNALATQKNITRKQLEEVSIEGLKKEWPFPPIN